MFQLKYFYFLLFLIAFPFHSNSRNYETKADGNWNTKSTWGDDIIPTEDNKTETTWISISHEVTKYNEGSTFDLTNIQRIDIKNGGKLIIKGSLLLGGTAGGKPPVEIRVQSGGILEIRENFLLEEKFCSKNLF